MVLLFSSFPWFWACHQHDEELVHVGTSGFVVSPCNLQVFRQHSTLYLCTSGVPTTRRQYGAELFTLGALFLAHMAMAGSASLNVEMILRAIPPLKSNGWLVLLPHTLLDLVKCGCTHSVAELLHTALQMSQLQRTFWLKWSLFLHKLRESVTPVNTIRCTRWPSDWWWPMTSSLYSIALCCTSSTRVLARVTPSFAYTRSLHVLQHSTMYLSICT